MMYQHRKSLSGLLLILLLFNTAMADNQFQSISEIKANTPARWTQTYQTQWRTVDIDTAVEVPDVRQFPIIRVTPCDPIDTQLLTNYAEVPTNEQGTLVALRNGYGVGVGTNEQFKDVQYFYDGAIPDHLPEDNPLTYQGALDIANTELTRLFGSVTSDLSVSETAVFSRYYHFKVKNKEKVWLDPDPNYSKGKYWIIFDQKFHDIGFEESIECYNSLRLGKESTFCEAQVLMDITDNSDFSIHSHLYQEVDVVYDDIPILPYEAAKTAIEEEIMAGHLRTIDTMALCYAPYFDPDNSDVFWLLPVWYVKGAYTRNAKRDFAAWVDDATGLVADSGVEYLEVVYQAQLGKLMDYNDASRTRRNVPKVITWNDVK
ncbi:MAG: hypothetical protein VB104_10960 [Candidatus Limiplasma sp.]|nr:hypothetical protein [Candidatus Limiplasma sp.]